MTTNQTERVTDEELDQMILKLERDGMTPKQLSLMRELREVRRAKGEPVAWRSVYHESNGLLTGSRNVMASWGRMGWDIQPLYTAQPASGVPDECALFEAAIDKCRKSETIDEHAWNNGVLVVMARFEECRAAMQLSGNSEQLEPVSNRDELPYDPQIAEYEKIMHQSTPNGWRLVPEEPTKEMIDAGWLHFMGTKNPSSKGVYKAMLEAAPKEVG